MIDFLFVIIELFFAISYGWNVIRETCRSWRVSKGSWSL